MPTGIERYKPTLWEKNKRAFVWPRAFLHYYEGIREVAPDMTGFSVAKYAWLHTHHWIWYNISWGDLYVPGGENDRED